MDKDKAFVNHRNNGFVLNFPNGNWLSTIWGEYSYSDNHDLDFDIEELKKGINKKLSSNTCEVMPNCSELVFKLLEATFPEEANGGIFCYLTFEKWLKMVNILNENK